MMSRVVSPAVLGLGVAATAPLFAGPPPGPDGREEPGLAPPSNISYYNEFIPNLYNL